MCKWECATAGPKALRSLDAVSEGGARVPVPVPPPVSTVTVKVEKAVNPRDHKLEVAYASAICHSIVLLGRAFW